jgi:hypothetical protein
MTHGCSAFSVTRRNLTPLDIVTAHSILPGRDDIALLLEEAMRGDGWTGGRMEHRRRSFDERMKRRGKRRNIRDDVGKVLGVNPKWWGPDSDSSTDSESEDEDEEDDCVYVSLRRTLPDRRNAKVIDRRLRQTTRLCSYFHHTHFPRFSTHSLLTSNHLYEMPNPRIPYTCWPDLLV